MAKKEEKKEEEKKKEPEIKFDEISKELAEIEHQRHIDKISPAVTDVFIKHSKYKDAKGVEQFKTTFTKDEAEKLADDVYNALAYHSHRRVFGMNEDQYQNLLQYKDPNGNPYVDGVTQMHFKINRRSLKKTLARDDTENEISAGILEQLLKKPIQEHAELLTSGLLQKHNLDDPKHMAAVKQALEGIVKKYHIGKKVIDMSKLHTPDDFLDAYVSLSLKYYKKGHYTL